MNSTTLNQVIQFPPRRIAAVLATAALWAGSLASTEAGPHPSLRVVAPEQVVIIGATGGLFEADVLVGPDGHACGQVRFALRDGTIIELKPIYGIVHQDRTAANGQTQPVEFNNVGVSLVLTPRIGPPTTPDDFVIATVRPSIERGCDIWDLAGSSMSGGTSGVPFDAQTRHLPSDERCEPADLGQFDIAVVIYAPRQTVSPFEAADPLDFSANVLVAHKNKGFGFVEAPLSDRGGLYQIFFGTVLPHAERGFQIFLVGMRPHPQGRPTNDDFLRAAVFPMEDNPDAQNWDLVNGESGLVRHAATVEAETHLQFFPAPGH